MSATESRYNEARKTMAAQLLAKQTPIERAKRVAEHYCAQATAAQQVLRLCELAERTGGNADVEVAALRLLAMIEQSLAFELGARITT